MKNKIDRSIAPQITTPEYLDVKNGELKPSPKGVKVYHLPFDEYEVIRISLVFNAGTKYQSQPFCATSTASMLTEGCERYSAQQIAELLDFYGIFFEVSTDRDYSVITICSLSRFLEQILDMLSSVLLAPTFPDNEFDIFKTKRKQSLIVQRSKIDNIAREEFAKALFGAEHAYGTSYSETLLDELKREHLQAYYNEFFTRDNMFAVVSGSISDSGLEQLNSILDSMPDGAPKQSDISKIETTYSIYKEQSDGLQSAIRIGRVMFPREHPDFIGMQVVSTILGGYFGSRLISNIREDKGYTYSIFSGMINLQQSGYLAISSEVEVSVTDAAVKEIFFEMERMRNELVPQEELDMVKNVLIGEIMRILDGPFGIADITIENIQNATDNSSLERMVQEVKSITPEMVMELSKRYLDKSDFVTVIVGEMMHGDE